jgi:CheY-like chemotaxis protein
LARKILLADDSVTAQNMGRKILADAGYEVIAVNNGSAALKKVTEIKPDLVVLDVYMPGYSGLEVCQRLKESPETGRIPVLLTVGKLEPFKPEEAQRVRAEAFIVKPFEASELLSALSKLEDKVVPRSEGSRPGRFARAIAAVEETGRSARGDDNGWKNRISFPHKKTEDEEKEEKKLEEQPSTYNPINRDLRTVVEPPAEKVAEKKEESTGREAQTVDVAALAPAGMSASSLPTDVTQEEVAAIAAAAAQIQVASAAIAEEKSVEAPTEPPRASDIETVGFEPPMREIDPGTAAVPSEIKASPEDFPVAKSESREAESREPESQDVPVTMAATAESVAGSSSGTPRWTAVAVALEAEEASISLEQEMQRVAAEASSAISSSQQESVPQDVPVTTAVFASENPVPVSTEQAFVPKLESVQSEPAAAVIPEYVVTAEEKAEKEDSVQARSDNDADSGKEDREVPQSLSQYEAPVAELLVTAPTAVEVPSSANEIEYATPYASAATYEPAVEASGWTQLREPDTRTALDTQAQPSSKDDSAPSLAEAEPAAAVASTAELQSSQPSPTAEFPSSASTFVPGEQLAESSSETNSKAVSQPQPESETVKSTAAAWANWRQIRDSKTEDAGAPESTPVEANAAAAAAGAERALSANSEQEEHPADVASIVDSVLADLRPKLMKEISRKMSEKK